VTIPVHYDDAAKTLTVGPVEGKYPGMPNSWTFQVVMVNAGHGVGTGETASPEKTVTFTGAKVSASF
jgi:alpha-D-xyloside xylohydrolase